MQNKAVPFQRIIGPLAEVPALLASMGADSAKAFAGLNIGPSDLAIGNLVPYSEILKLLANAARITDYPHFGLLLGQKHDHTSLGLLGQLMANAPTLGEALRDYVNWQIGLSRAAAAYLYRGGDYFSFGYGIYEREVPGSWQVYDLTITVGLNMVASLSGGMAAPEEILICHRAPKDRRPYEQILRTIPRFDQSQNSLILSEQALRSRVPGANALARAKALEGLSAMAGPDFSRTSARARHYLRGAICMGDVTMRALAGHLGAHPKTLERRLQEEGMSFELIRDEVRYAVARDLLDLTDLPVGDIALALSFATHSTFDHAFRRWSNMAPSDWRAKNSGNAKPR
jgi:AraC-like DNA-binding protein